MRLDRDDPPWWLVLGVAGCLIFILLVAYYA